jgi:protein-L-isoaspartate(D-aspartate) O-methyltransferase
MRVATFLIITLWILPVQLQQDFEQRRKEMVKDQIEERGVKDPATLAALRKVPRHLFVPKNIIDDAYDDRPLPIGYGQTISQPYIVGYMTEIVKPQPDHRVLEIGTGSGYQAAILSEIVKEVYTIELIDSLGSQAKNRLGKLNYKKVTTKTGDGYYGWKDKAPFDAIVVTAAAEHIPPPLIEQLKEGGRMIIPVGSPFMVQQLMLVEKKGGMVRSTNMMPVRFVPFKRSQ